MRRFTEEERVEVWDRWQAGVANRLIGRDLGRSAGSIRAFVESWGGVRPPVRHRSPRHLSLSEREEISRGVAAGDSLLRPCPRSSPCSLCSSCSPQLHF